MQARNLAELTYERKRLALHAMNLTVKVWSTGHTQRYEITTKLPVPGEARCVNDPQSDCGGGHDDGRVNVNSRRGYVRNREGRGSGDAVE